MQRPAPTPPRAAPGFLLARCLRCAATAVMAARQTPPQAGSTQWQVYCRQCQGWSPGYPLVAPQKGDHRPPGTP